jgi:hypothetical protein
MKLRARNSKLHAWNSKVRARNMKVRARNSKLDVRNSKLDVRNTKLRPRNSKLDVRNSKLDVRNSKLDVRNSKLLVFLVFLVTGLLPCNVTTESEAPVKSGASDSGKHSQSETGNELECQRAQCPIPNAPCPMTND